MVDRRWGRFEVLSERLGYKVKELTIFPRKSISLQYHNHRDEHWVILSGTGLVQHNDHLIDVSPGKSYTIRKGEIHKVLNTGKDNLIIIEVQVGTILSEDDIIRLEAIDETNL